MDMAVDLQAVDWMKKEFECTSAVQSSIAVAINKGNNSHRLGNETSGKEPVTHSLSDQTHTQIDGERVTSENTPEEHNPFPQRPLDKAVKQEESNLCDMMPDQNTECNSKPVSAIKPNTRRSKVQNAKEKKAYTCDECGKCFPVPSKLDRHRRTHTGEKPYKCEYCEKGFSRESSLKYHVTSHTGKKSFKCAHCDKMFPAKYSLVEHVRIHTGEKPHECSQCGKCFRHRGSLLGHVKIHTGVKAFSCDFCKKSFLRASKLKRHLKTHNKQGKISAHKGREVLDADSDLDGCSGPDGQEPSSKREGMIERPSNEIEVSSEPYISRNNLNELSISNEADLSGEPSIIGISCGASPPICTVHVSNTESSSNKSSEVESRKRKVTKDNSVPSCLVNNTQERYMQSESCSQDDELNDTKRCTVTQGESLPHDVHNDCRIDDKLSDVSQGDCTVFNITNHKVGDHPHVASFAVERTEHLNQALHSPNIIDERIEREKTSGLIMAKGDENALQSNKEIPGNQHVPKVPNTISLPYEPNKMSSELHSKTDITKEIEIDNCGSIPESIKRNTSHPCSQCIKHFSSASKLKRHLQSHSRDKSAKCEVCWKYSFSADSEKLHMTTQKGENSFCSPYCGLGHPDKSALEKGIRPITYDHCNKGFSEKSKLVTHTQVHTGRKPYKCEICSKSFSDKRGLKSHVNTHNGSEQDSHNDTNETDLRLNLDDVCTLYKNKESCFKSKSGVNCKPGVDRESLRETECNTIEQICSELEASSEQDVYRNVTSQPIVSEQGNSLEPSIVGFSCIAAPQTVTVHISDVIVDKNGSMFENYGGESNGKRAVTEKNFISVGTENEPQKSTEKHDIQQFAEAHDISEPSNSHGPSIVGLACIAAPQTVTVHISNVIADKDGSMIENYGGKSNRKRVVTEKNFISVGKENETQKSTQKHDIQQFTEARNINSLEVEPNEMSIEIPSTAGAGNEMGTYTLISVTRSMAQKKKILSYSQSNKRFPDASKLERHSQSHSRRKPVKCEDCGKYFFSASELKIHMKLHTQENSFKCTDCGLLRPSKSALDQHMRAHRGEKPFTCSQCDKSFKYSGTLKLHLVKHAGIKPCICELCGKGFLGKIKLAIHMRVHKGGKPYKCEICSKYFSDKLVLKRHLKTHPKEKSFSGPFSNELRNKQDSNCEVSGFKSKTSVNIEPGVNRDLGDQSSAGVNSKLDENSKPGVNDKISDSRKLSVEHDAGGNRALSPHSEEDEMSRLENDRRSIIKINLSIPADVNGTNESDVYSQLSTGKERSAFRFSSEAAHDTCEVNISEVFSNKNSSTMVDFPVECNEKRNTEEVTSDGDGCALDEKSKEASSLQNTRAGRHTKDESVSPEHLTDFGGESDDETESSSPSGDKESREIEEEQTKKVRVTNDNIGVFKSSEDDTRTCDKGEPNVVLRDDTGCSSGNVNILKSREIGGDEGEKEEGSYKIEMKTTCGYNEVRGSHETHEGDTERDSSLTEVQGEDNISPLFGSEEHADVLPESSSTRRERIDNEGRPRFDKECVSQLNSENTESEETSVTPEIISGSASDNLTSELPVNEIEKQSRDGSDSGNKTLKQGRRKSYPCSQCNKSFPVPSKLKRHMGSHKRLNRKESLWCSQCNKQFKCASKLKRHLHSHSGIKSAKCEECGKMFSHEGTLKVHMKLHTGEDSSRCPYCDACCTTKSALERHLRTHTGEKPFKCSQCEKSYKEAGSLKLHMTTHTGFKPFVCEQCGKCFPKSSKLKRHMGVHTGERPYKCEVCSKCFTDAWVLRNHHKTHTGEKPFSCKVCGRCFSAAHNLSNHMLTHSGEKPFKCFCGRCFTQRKELKKHKRTHSDAGYVCKVCNKHLPSSYALTIHARTHTGEKPFMCDQCGKCFSQSRNLREHMMNHTGDKPFKCDECGLRFVSDSVLKAHKRLHTGEKPYSCEHCGKTFRTTGARGSHIKVHLTEKPFICTCGKGFSTEKERDLHSRMHSGETPHRCEYCGKCFPKACRLQYHLRTHTGEKPFICYVCGKCFSQVQSMRLHVKRQHPDSQQDQQ